MDPRTTIERFDRLLQKRGLALDAVVIGGTALALLGVITRHTEDCDIIHPELSPDILAAACDLAAADPDLGADWLNNGPASITAELPPGWMERLVTAYQGRALTLRSLGRMDLLRTKLFAYCDRQRDLPDCIALKPTAEEIDEILPWLEHQDANPDWPAHVRSAITDLQRRLSDGV